MFGFFNCRWRAIYIWSAIFQHVNHKLYTNSSWYIAIHSATVWSYDDAGNVNLWLVSQVIALQHLHNHMIRIWAHQHLWPQEHVNSLTCVTSAPSPNLCPFGSPAICHIFLLQLLDVWTATTVSHSWPWPSCSSCWIQLRVQLWDEETIVQGIQAEQEECGS